MNVSYTVLDTITDHIVLEHVVHEVGIYMIGGLLNLQETLTNVSKVGGFGLSLFFLSFHCYEYTSRAEGTLCC